MTTKVFYGYVIYEPIFTGEIWDENWPYDHPNEAEEAGKRFMNVCQKTVLVVRLHETIEYDVTKELLSHIDNLDIYSMNETEYADYVKTIDDPRIFGAESYKESDVYYSYYSDKQLDKSIKLKYSSYEYAYNNAQSDMSNGIPHTLCLIRKHVVSEYQIMT